MCGIFSKKFRSIRMPRAHRYLDFPQIDCKKRYNHCKAFTLIEILIVLSIIGTLLGLGIPNIINLLNKAKISQACSDIAITGQKIGDYLIDYGTLPEALNELERVNLVDPWGNSYQYLVILGKKKSEIQGKWRKDRFLVPINSDFDLYSMGKDGESRSPLTAKPSWDDIVRANDGDYVGLASKY